MKGFFGKLTLIWGGGGNFNPLLIVPLINKKQKLQPWHFEAFTNILSDTFVPNLVI